MMFVDKIFIWLKDTGEKLNNIIELITNLNNKLDNITTDYIINTNELIVLKDIKFYKNTAGLKLEIRGVDFTDNKGQNYLDYIKYIDGEKTPLNYNIDNKLYNIIVYIKKKDFTIVGNDMKLHIRLHTI